MDPDVISFAVVAVVIVVAVTALSPIVVWLVRTIKQQPASRELPNPIYDHRFEQLQQSVDAIAVEVERIAEAQRFSARLLAERSETPPLPR